MSDAVEMEALRTEVLLDRPKLERAPTACPFDGGAGQLRTILASKHYIACATCGASGPLASSPDVALELWEHRS